MDLIQEAFAQVRDHGKRLATEAKIRSLNACYRKALKDPETKIPTYLHAALAAMVDEA